ncbi:MAG: glutamate--tRNA ligase [Bacteriovoracaceae bacterium]
MTVRVRFAPSPTGYLHVGGGRTALYNYLFAKAMGGTYILRVEDTDEVRSTREFEQLQIADLKWLGIEHTEGPDVGGPYGPYRQSERKHIYTEHAEKLLNQNKAYHCFCTEAELEAKKEIALQANLSPHYDGKCRSVSLEEAKKRLQAGEKAVIRFRTPMKTYHLHDHVRGEVSFPEDMVGDFVIIRSEGLPVFNFVNAVDDMLMKITHVIRAEEHLSNTVRQLMIYEAFAAKPPEYAHISLLTGKDRQKLSKRHGATSVNQYREDTYLPQAMVNYLCQLGWSHPEEKDIFTMQEIEKVFSIDRFNKSPAIFDVEKLNWMNGQHLRQLPMDLLIKEVSAAMPAEHEFHKQNDVWKNDCLTLFKEQIQFFKELPNALNVLFDDSFEKSDELTDIFSWETTPKLAEYLLTAVSGVTTPFITTAQFDEWSNHIKNELKIKGKPLFMGMRAVLTGHGHGPDLKVILPLTPIGILKNRVHQIVGAMK